MTGKSDTEEIVDRRWGPGALGTASEDKGILFGGPGGGGEGDGESWFPSPLGRPAPLGEAPPLALETDLGQGTWTCTSRCSFRENGWNDGRPRGYGSSFGSAGYGFREVVFTRVNVARSYVCLFLALTYVWLYRVKIGRDGGFLIPDSYRKALPCHVLSAPRKLSMISDFPVTKHADKQPVM